MASFPVTIDDVWEPYEDAETHKPYIILPCKPLCELLYLLKSKAYPFQPNSVPKIGAH